MKLSAEEKRWQAEDDARTLMRAEEVKQDPGRIANAQAAIKQMAEEKKKEADILQKLSTGKKIGITSGPGQGKQSTQAQRPRENQSAVSGNRPSWQNR